VAPIRKAINSTRSLVSDLRRYRNLFSNADAMRLVLPERREIAVRVYSKELARSIWLRRNTSDLAVALKILEGYEYDLNLDFEPRVVIDAGANIGVSSLFFAKRFPKARIHAIEPEESNFSLLQSNCEGIENIVAHRAALWPYSTQLLVSDTKAEKWAFSFEERCGMGNIPAITIADIVKQEGTDIIDILKLDIEGGEKALFSNGVAEWLPMVKIIIIELHDRFVSGCSKAFYSSICSRTFSQEVLGENLVIRFSQGA
jgi:FkbM family methyltransferase